MEDEDKYFKNNYSFLTEPDFHILKPDDNLICCNDLVLVSVNTNIQNKPTTNIQNYIIQVIKNLYNIYPINYYNNLLQILNSNSSLYNLPINIQRKKLNNELKEIFMRYLISTINYIIIISPIQLINIDYDICYILDNLTEKQIIGIIFQIEFQNNPLQKYTYYSSISNNYNKKMFIYYSTKKIQEQQYQYQIYNYNNKIEITQVIFNELSLEVLDYMRLDRLLYNNFKQSFYNHLIYKRFLYHYIKIEYQIRFLLFSCSALFALGTTYCRDIDLLVYDKYMNEEINNIIHTYLININMIDLHLKGYGEWVEGEKKEYLNQWFEKDWPNLYGSSNLEETFFNPEFHFYFLGLKIISYKADIARRIKRNRPTSYTDLLMLDYFNGMIITPEHLSRQYWVNNELKEYTDDDLIGLIIKIIKYIVRWHKLIISAHRVYEYIIFPSDFKISTKFLDKIDKDNLEWIKTKNFKIIDIKENLVKRKIIIKK